MSVEKKIRLLVVDDEEAFARALAKRLELRSFDVTVVFNGADALAAARKQEYEVALVDLRMPGLSGEDTIEELKDEHPFLEVVVLTGHGSVDSAVECIKLGSRHYLQKPCETQTLLTVLREAYEVRLRRKFKADEDKMARLQEIALGDSPLGILRRFRKLEFEDE